MNSIYDHLNIWSGHLVVKWAAAYCQATKPKQHRFAWAAEWQNSVTPTLQMHTHTKTHALTLFEDSSELLYLCHSTSHSFTPGGCTVQTHFSFYLFYHWIYFYIILHFLNYVLCIFTLTFTMNESHFFSTTGGRKLHSWIKFATNLAVYVMPPSNTHIKLFVCWLTLVLLCGQA